MKIAVITGASSGMGKEFVLQFEKYIKVDEVWVIARRADKLEELRDKVKCNLRAISLDLLDSKSFDEYKELLEEHKPEVELLVNCAGFGKFGRYENIPLEDNINMINLNCTALVVMTELTLPYMSKGSKVIQLDSLSAFQPVPYITVYGATKAFVLSYSRAMNRELKPRGIRMMAVNPAWVRTEFFDHSAVTNNNDVNYFNKIYEAKDVVKTALRDLYKRKKDYSVHGFPVRMQVRLVKLMPHSFVMNVWQKQQKKAKNDENMSKFGK